MFLYRKYPPPLKIDFRLRSNTHLRTYISDIASTAIWQIIREQPDLQYNFDLENIYYNLCNEWRKSNFSVRDSDRTHLIIFLSTLRHITSCRYLAHGGRRKNRKCWTIAKTLLADLLPHTCFHGPFQTQESIKHLITYIQFQIDTIFTTSDNHHRVYQLTASTIAHTLVELRPSGNCTDMSIAYV